MGFSEFFQALVEFILSTGERVEAAFGPLINFSYLGVTVFLLLVGWLSFPEKGIKKFNVPLLTMITWVLAFYFLNLTVFPLFSPFGWQLIDVIICTLFVLVGGLWWVGANAGKKGRVACIIIGILVLIAVGGLAMEGPDNSFLSNCIRWIANGISTLFGAVAGSS